MKRIDGRKPDEMREMSAKAGIIPRADGSGYFQIGNTIAYAAVYGPRNLYPRFLQDPQKGILRVNYNMMPFSSKGERVRPGGNRRSKELGLVIEKSLLPVVNLYEFPNAVVDVFVELPQTDAGTRCAGICAAAIALADAGIPMRDLVAAVSAGKAGDTVILDLNYEEDSAEEGADIPVAMTGRSKEITLLQMDGRMTAEDLRKAVQLCRKGISQIIAVQQKALQEKYAP
ncbi:exosome complex exonuclease Rrp41 [Candidatus Woesearchaeota archaeon]|nr:exosome complex exonuclease Rrp41 [Candidatus Woesearchaeota archaeon]